MGRTDCRTPSPAAPLPRRGEKAQRLLTVRSASLGTGPAAAAEVPRSRGKLKL